MLADAAEHRAVITVEDGVRDGGIGSTIAACVGELSPATVTCSLGIPAQFIPHAGTPDEILSRLGLDHTGIAAAVHTALARRPDAELWSRWSVETVPDIGQFELATPESELVRCSRGSRRWCGR